MARIEKSRRGRAESRDGGSRSGSSRRDSGSNFSDRGPRGRNDFEERSSRYPDRESRHGSRNRRDFKMTAVTCASCGAECEVPFKPTSNKPVYCDECFGKKGGSDNNSNINLDKINEKLDKIMKALKIE